MDIMTRVFALILALLPTAALAQGCPEPLASARRLVLVAADSVDGSAAGLQRFVRATPAARWRPVGAPADVLVGKKGLAWGHAFRRFARAGEPVKREGDRRAPAGFYRIGRPFGLAASAQPGYLHISAGMTCVDDVRSPAYNTITTRAKVGWRVHGENMWRVPEYRRGLLVDYPSDRKARAGSCIFIHLRRPDATGTGGCVAVPERDLIALQDFAQEGAVLAVLPRQARDRFAGCLPPAAQP
jgi:L,D-peptidoglycan transpeptidase YkuD (ErfK/YbiS/YcfS/YnhG family)